MNPRLPFFDRPSIGVSVGPETVRWAEVHRRKGLVHEVLLDAEPIGEGGLSTALRSLSARSDITVHAVASHLSRDQVRSVEVERPVTSVDDRDRWFATAASPLIPDGVPDGAVVVRAEPLWSDRGVERYLIAAASSRAVEAQVEAFRQAGLRLSALTHVPLALPRAFPSVPPDKTTRLTWEGPQGTWAVRVRGGALVAPPRYLPPSAEAERGPVADLGDGPVPEPFVLACALAIADASIPHPNHRVLSFLDSNDAHEVVEERDRQEAVPLALRALGIAALLLFITSTLQWGASNRLAEAQEARLAMAGQTRQIEEAQRDLERLRLDIDTAQRLVDTRTQTSVGLATVGRLVPNDVWLRSVTMDSVGITIAGQALPGFGLSDFLARLEQAPEFQSALLLVSETGATDDARRQRGFPERVRSFTIATRPR